MTYIETTRVNDLIALQIGAIQKSAQQLNVNSELQSLEAILASIEKESNVLRQTLKAIPNSEHKVSHEIFPHVTGDKDSLS